MTPLTSHQLEQLQSIIPILAQQRQALNISLEEISLKTHIPLRTLKALEGLEAQTLPEAVFIQGFIRRYADALGLAGQELASQFSVMPAPMSAVSPLPSAPRPGSWRVVAGLLGVGCLAAGGLMYNLTQPRIARISPGPTPVRSSLPVLPPPQPPSLATVNLQLLGRSWVQVTADGHLTYTGILTKGDNKSWSAKHKIEVVLGNAGAVQGSLDQGSLKVLGLPGQVKTIIVIPLKHPPTGS